MIAEPARSKPVNRVVSPTITTHRPSSIVHRPPSIIHRPPSTAHPPSMTLPFGPLVIHD